MYMFQAEVEKHKSFLVVVLSKIQIVFKLFTNSQCVKLLIHLTNFF